MFRFAPLASILALITLTEPLSGQTVTISDVTQSESTSPFVFTLTLSSPSATPVTVNYSTADGTATAPADYTAVTGTATFAANTTTTTVAVTVLNDDTAEFTSGFGFSESFVVNLSAAVGAAIGDTQGIGTILDDDPVPRISISDVAAPEGNAGTTPFVFTLTLSNPNRDSVSVNYRTNPSFGTAIGGDTPGTDVDYIHTRGRDVAVFAPGAVSQTITVHVVGDVLFERDETFFVFLDAPLGGSIADAQGQGTILADDPATADLAILKRGPTEVAPSSAVTYTILVSNDGPQAATNVVVTDVLPAGSTLQSASTPLGTCSGTTTVTCSLGTVGNGLLLPISLTVLAPDTPGTMTNTASVAATEFDPTTSNNTSSSGPTTVLGTAAIPTLSEWAMLALLSALAGIAALKLRV